jgi:hypothetical protein
LVAPAAVAVGSPLLRLVLPLVVLGAFAHLYWMAAPGWGHFGGWAVALYGAVLAAAPLTHRWPALLRQVQDAADERQERRGAAAL